MTKKQFFKELATALGRNPAYRVNLYGDDTTQQTVRLDGPDGPLCPLTFLTYDTSGDLLSSEEWIKASEILGLKYSTARDIVDAADNWNEFEWYSATQRQLAKAPGMEGR